MKTLEFLRQDNPPGGQANSKEIPNYKHPTKKTAGRQITNKSQISSTKLQINHKFQASNYK